MENTSEPSSTAIEPAAVVATNVGYRHDRSTTIGPLDLIVPSGSVTALVGPNGAGKSTILDLFAGRLVPSRGQLTWHGHAAPTEVGYAAQHVELDPEMRADELLELFGALERLGRAARRAAIDDVATRFALGSFLRRRVANLSGGMRRRLHLAIALLSSPSLLLLDEPTTGLDREGLAALDACLRERDRRTIVVATHDLDLVERVATDVVVVSGGRIESVATRDAVAREHGSFARAYAHLVPGAGERDRPRRGRRD